MQDLPNWIVWTEVDTHDTHRNDATITAHTYWMDAGYLVSQERMYAVGALSICATLGGTISYGDFPLRRSLPAATG